MIAKKLKQNIRKFKGPIFLMVDNFNDSFWVKVSKADLLVMIDGSFDDDFETGFTLDLLGYFGKDYEVE